MTPVALLVGAVESKVPRKHTNLLVYCLLFVLDLLLELLQLCRVRRRPVCLQHLNVPVTCFSMERPAGGRSAPLLIGQRRDLLLFYFVVGEVLLVLLPVLARGAGHGWLCGLGSGVCLRVVVDSEGLMGIARSGASEGVGAGERWLLGVWMATAL